MSTLKANTISTNDANNVALDNSLKLKNYTTTQRDALTSVAGDTIYNTTENKVQYYTGTEWLNTGSADLVGDLEYIATMDYSSSSAGSGQNVLTTALKVDGETKMGLISDIKQELRKVNALKINYTTRIGDYTQNN